MGLERLLGMYLVKSIPVTNIAFQTLKGLPLNVRGVSRLNIRILPNCGGILLLLITSLIDAVGVNQPCLLPHFLLHSLTCGSSL